MTADYIVCGKLDNRTELGPFSVRAAAKVKLHAENGLRNRQDETLSVSIGENGVWFDGQLWDTKALLTMAVTKGIKRLLVLTRREYLQIAEQAAAHALRVDIFETNFPFFSDIKYSSCPRTNHGVLIKHLRKQEQLGIRSDSLSKDLSRRYSRLTVKKLRFKNGYDRHFFFAYKDGYQEVFKLKEERPDRIIIALDFNSMYLDSMQGRFCDPASIEYKDFRGLAANPRDLANGIYRVRLLSARQSFLLDHHPFRYKRLGRSFYFRMNCGDTIETLLHKNEIDYFSSFFERVEIVEGLFSVDTIVHPLLKKGLELYAQRLYHRRRGDRIKENLCKASMQHMHSVTNQKRFAKRCFDSMELVRDFLSAQFAMNFGTFGPDEVADFLNRHKYFALARTPQGYQLSYLNLGASSNVFSLSAQVVANARLKLLKTLERFLKYRSVELCYANVDSIHISILRDELEGFLEQNRDMISDQLGTLRVEAIADQGYWFDVGRYWLKKEGEVVLFKNKGFNRKSALGPFVCRRKVSNFIDTPTFAHLHTYVTKIENAFSYHKRLEHRTSKESRFVRFGYEEIKELHAANLSEARERMSSMKAKIELFQRISNKRQTNRDEG